jgi:acetolactate synthase-1/2/3 large subunit
VPFATAAALGDRSRQVIALIGDGAFGFTAIEISTAVRHGAKALFIIANNSAWNIDRHDQIERYNGRLVGVELPDHRYDMVAQGLGAYAERVSRVEDLDGAIRRGLQRAPAVLNVMITREATSPDFRSGLAAVPPMQPLRHWNELEQNRYQ